MSRFVIFVLTMAVITTVVVGAADDRITDGMKCHTTNGFTYCEGKGANYVKTETEIKPQTEDVDSLHDKSFFGSSGTGSSKPATTNLGFLPQTRCHRSDGRKCDQVNVDITPTFLVNVRNQNRYIAQLGALQQRVRLAICTESKCGYGRCEQKYATVQLYAWETNTYSSRLFPDQFRIPSCCRCSRPFAK